MDAPKIQERLDQINVEMEQMKANFAKLDGHRAECLHWLSELKTCELMAFDNGQVAEASNVATEQPSLEGLCSSSGSEC